MYPVLFRLGRFTVTGYAALVDVGLIVGTAVTCLAARWRDIHPARALDGALAAALGGLTGGRAAYVAANWSYFQTHVRRALRPRDGGLAWHGALVSEPVAVLVHCVVRRTPSSRCRRRWRWILSRRVSDANAAPRTDRHML